MQGPAWRKIAPAWRKSATAWPPSGAMTSRAVRYFEVCHFVEGPFKADDEAREKLRQHCVGLPVFSPDPGYGWSHEWARHVVDELACFPSLVDDILDGRIECRGQRLTDLAPFKVPPYAGAVVTKEHLFEDVEDAIKSYECCWLRSADFPEKKPPWARITDEEYDTLKNVFYSRPTHGRGYLLQDEDCSPGDYDGFYNYKHRNLHMHMLEFID